MDAGGSELQRNGCSGCPHQAWARLPQANRLACPGLPRPSLAAHPAHVPYAVALPGFHSIAPGQGLGFTEIPAPLDNHMCWGVTHPWF